PEAPSDNGRPGRGRQDDDPLPAEKGRARLDDPDDRLQRGGVEHRSDRPQDLGRGRPIRGARALEPLRGRLLVRRRVRGRLLRPRPLGGGSRRAARVDAAGRGLERRRARAGQQARPSRGAGSCSSGGRDARSRPVAGEGVRCLRGDGHHRRGAARGHGVARKYSDE
ncbi:UNVERIFIED_CONTAM: hypothetical protein GTU68_048383, partial [Idotea baltica]|nr:hypothetical protein [Idotea baltica]